MNNTHPSIQVGSEVGDINREIKKLIKDHFDGNNNAWYKIIQLSRRREELLAPRKKK